MTKMRIQQIFSFSFYFALLLFHYALWFAHRAFIHSVYVVVDSGAVTREREREKDEEVEEQQTHRILFLRLQHYEQLAIVFYFLERQRNNEERKRNNQCKNRRTVERKRKREEKNELNRK